MTFLDVRMQSWVLGTANSMYVILPDYPAVKDCKVLYLLHGLGDDCSTWVRRTSIERYASRYNIAVVMPNGARSFYSDTIAGEKYYEHVAKEVPMFVENTFQVSSDPKNKFIAGLSMGGYGALKIGLRECGSFAACAGLSSAADAVNGISRQFIPHVFGEEGPGKEDDLFYLAEQAVNRADKPRIYIGEGKQDFLYKDNEAFRKKLDDIGYEYTYRESDGDHCWDFWDEYIQYVLEWMLNE